MITSVHSLIYSDDAPATRAFFRDVLGWPYVEDTESDAGWLIFQTGPSELGVHPTSGMHEGRPWSATRHHAISLMCDDIAATRKELEDKGATFSGEIADHGYGQVTMLQVPGADDIQLYEPSHPTAYDL
ncbi:MAG TPA: VOC family protein [Nocardioidaceae bacterium]|jgi:predicted enzyme related to lactoylglutathione lyase